MKKIFLFSFILLVVLSFFKLEKNQVVDNRVEVDDEVRAIYISYIELQKYLGGKDENSVKQTIDTMIENIKNDKFNWIILHVRAFSDSLYPSNIFPTHYLVYQNEEEDIPFDILAYFIEKSHEDNIQLHAWINPFRIRNTPLASNISIKNPAFKWFGTNHVKVIENKGIYYNPASIEAQNLILNGIEEILDNYDVDGIHFDDYFYPDATIDLENYEDYVKNGGTLSLHEYRLNIINEFIKKVYNLIKEKDENVLFGIAPEGNMENNLEKNFADINKWLEEDGYIDYIMPQLYYGFQNANKPYAEVLNDWNQMIKNEVSLIPALAFYKTGEYDEYAGSGNLEWQTFTNIIKNQIEFARSMKNDKGFAIFRYGNLYEEKTEIRQKEYENFQNLLKNS